MKSLRIIYACELENPSVRRQNKEGCEALCSGGGQTNPGHHKAFPVCVGTEEGTFREVTSEVWDEHLLGQGPGTRDQGWGLGLGEDARTPRTSEKERELMPT